MRIDNTTNSLNNAWSRLGKSKSDESAAASAASPLDITDELLLSDNDAEEPVNLYRPELFAPRPDGNVYIEDVRTQFKDRLSTLEGRLRRVFAENGIDTSQPIPLRTGTDGHVFVAGEHPQKAEIEQLFRDDRDLRNHFVGAQAQAEFLRAADEAMAFQAAYRKNPEAALAEFSHLFDDRHDEFTLTFQGGKAETTFTPAA